MFEIGMQEHVGDELVGMEIAAFPSDRAQYCMIVSPTGSSAVAM